MKKNLFRIAALALVGACMTACSSGDDEATNEKVNPQPKKDNIVILKGSLESPMTRSTITEDASGANAVWKTGDKVMIRYAQEGGTTATVEATINNDGTTATYTATLTNPVNGGEINYVYPSDCYNGSAAPYINTSGLATQNGTLENIGNNHNIQTGTSTMKITGGVAIPATNPLPMESQVCIAKFNLQTRLTSSSYGDYPATKLVVSDGTNTYTINSTPARSTFYVAMLPVPANTSVTLTATGNILTYIKDLTPPLSSDDEGKIIGVNPETYVAKLYTRGSGEMSKTYAHTTLNAGKYYPLDVPIANDITPIALVVHAGSAVTGYCENFIALALEDATSGTVSVSSGQASAVTWASNHKIKIGETTYQAVVGRGSNEPYDRVYDNVFSVSPYVSKGTDYPNWESSATSTTALKGWRVPTVTDWRYVIKFGGGRDADKPKGIGDHNALYPQTLTSIDGTPKIHYYQGDVTDFVTNLNNACGNTNLQVNYYWTGSQLHAGQETAKNQGNKIWRYNFADGAFQWNAGGDDGDNSHIRLVLAY